MQVVIEVARVPFSQGRASETEAKCHATVGHTTVIATATFVTIKEGLKTMLDMC